MNQCLPDFAKVEFEGKKVDKNTIQRRLKFEDKFKTIIPAVTSRNFIEDHPRKAKVIIDIKKLRDDLGDRLWSRFQHDGLTVVECNWADARVSSQ